MQLLQTPYIFILQLNSEGLVCSSYDFPCCSLVGKSNYEVEIQIQKYLKNLVQQKKKLPLPIEKETILTFLHRDSIFNFMILEIIPA